MPGGLKMKRRKWLVIAVQGLVAMMLSSGAAMAAGIDGVIDAGEWTGAATYTIGNGGGTAYLKADQNYIYGAFDITGWTSAMGAASNGNLLGFGVWKVNGGYGTSAGVEFQQATDKDSWGGDGPSGTMNGLDSAFRLSTVLQGAIPGDLQAMDSFATGHRVWEVMMPIGTMGVSVGDTIYAVGGINYDGLSHWFPDYFPTGGWNQYAPVRVEAAATPEPASMLLLGFGLIGLAGFSMRRKK
jgi:hypothetical protein